QQGSVFKLTVAGSGYTSTSLHNFTGGTDGAFPEGHVIVDANGNVYGTTYSGGSDHCVLRAAGWFSKSHRGPAQTRGAGISGCWLEGANEGAHEFSISFSSNRLNVQSFGCQHFPGFLGLVNACGLHLDLLKAD